MTAAAGGDIHRRPVYSIAPKKACLFLIDTGHHFESTSLHAPLSCFLPENGFWYSVMIYGLLFHRIGVH